MTITAPIAALVGAGLATCGWLYTARRQRALSRKQHTVNVLLQASFNPDYRIFHALLVKSLKEGKCPSLAPEDAELLAAFQMVANHYEFIAAGLRNGDFDERLVRDSWRGTMLTIFEKCRDFIWSLRTARRLTTIYEHLEWLHARWEKSPPNLFQRVLEWVIARPLQGKRSDPRG